MKTFKDGVAVVAKLHICLVYPLNNRKDVPSIWQSFYPRTPMKWEWTEDSDNRVADMWHLREKLSHCGKVVYLKWYQGRATFFSLEAYRLLLAFLDVRKIEKNLSPNSKKLLDVLHSTSPQSTRLIKKEMEWVGRNFESTYARHMKQLWQCGLIVGYGEVDDGAFPSLAVGAGELLFELEWRKLIELSPVVAEKKLKALLGEKSPFFVFAKKVKASLNLSEARRELKSNPRGAAAAALI